MAIHRLRSAWRTLLAEVLGQLSVGGFTALPGDEGQSRAGRQQRHMGIAVRGGVVQARRVDQESPLGGSVHAWQAPRLQGSAGKASRRRSPEYSP